MYVCRVYVCGSMKADTANVNIPTPIAVKFRTMGLAFSKKFNHCGQVLLSVTRSHGLLKYF